MTSYTKATMNNIAMCMPSRVLSTPLPGRTPSLKSSLPCLAFSHDSSQSRLVLSGGSRILSLPLGSAGSPGPVVAPRLLVRLGRGLRLPWLLGRPLRCLALPRVPGPTEKCTSHPCFRSLSNACMASIRIYCFDGCLGFRIAWMAVWSSVNMAHFPGFMLYRAACAVLERVP